MGLNTTFKDALEQASSSTLLEPNWAAILQVCDSIRQKDVTAKVAVSEIRKKIHDSDPHVSKNALIMLEACVKNCGSEVHEEVATREMMDEFRTLVTACPEIVKLEILRIINAWAFGFRNEPKYKIVEDTRTLMKMEGYDFPERNESDAMFSALKAPDWVDGDVCHRCRVKFGTFTRQHHCRCCGQVFCAKCSSKNSVIPKFGIEREVRVCDPCFDQLNPSDARSTSAAATQPSTKSSDNSELPAEYLNSALAKESQVPEKKSDADIKRQEQEDLQLAMALSVSEQESKNADGKGESSRIYDVIETRPSAPVRPSTYNYISSMDQERTENTDSELQHYLNRSYWEKKKEVPPAYIEPEEGSQTNSTLSQNEEGVAYSREDQSEYGAFMASFRSNVEKLMQRMQYVTSKGRHISNDSIAQTLFQTMSTMQPQLMNFIEQQEQEKDKYEGLEEKLGVLKETRRSLDILRSQHREKLRQQELEQDMLRRMQMEQKMELLRQQKHEYMLYQQQLQTQRQQALEQIANDQGNNSQNGPYQPSLQNPGMFQSTYTQYGPPPNYQSVNPGVQQYPAGRPDEASFQAVPTSQLQNMNLQEGPTLSQVPSVNDFVNPGYQPTANQACPPEMMTLGQYPQPNALLQQNQPIAHDIKHGYQQATSDGSRNPLEADHLQSGSYSYQAPLNYLSRTSQPGPPSLEQYPSGPNAPQSLRSNGPTAQLSVAQFPQAHPPTQQHIQSVQQVHPLSRHISQPNGVPLNQRESPSSQHKPLGMQAIPSQQGQGPPRGITTQGAPTQALSPQVPPPQGLTANGAQPTSINYQNQPADHGYQHMVGNEQWEHGQSGIYQHLPPRYGNYEQQTPPSIQQFTEQKTAEAQLISFD